MNRYERQLKLKAKGMRTLPASGISTGYDTVSGDRKPLIVFSSREAASGYVRCLTIAGDEWSDRASRFWSHKGWFSDSFQDETVKPAVCLMGEVMLYGYEQNGMLCFYSGKGEAARFHFEFDNSEFEDEFRRFAGYADYRAERIAEECRDYDEKWQEARKLEERIEELDSERRETLQIARAWVRDCKGAALTLTLCERIRGVVRDARKTAARLLEEIAESREQLKGLPA